MELTKPGRTLVNKKETKNKIKKNPYQNIKISHNKSTYVSNNIQSIKEMHNPKSTNSRQSIPNHQLKADTKNTHMIWCCIEKRKRKTESQSITVAI